ncbi:unnamed protein product [Hyaloperonospora brassicae]|uniref:Calmodulin n=1 Tax=Hyaloperonospora brassicae TaxID=162125 RepID=A0AAV0UR02_HYABA|nr:unnamed protein product [Hyaloperonospora brassicae]
MRPATSRVWQRFVPYYRSFRLFAAARDQKWTRLQARDAMGPKSATRRARGTCSRAVPIFPRKPLELQYGSVRKSWRQVIHKLAWFPTLQHLVLETASLLTRPEELEFYLPRQFHAKYSLGDKLGEGTFGTVYGAVPRQQELQTEELLLDFAVKVVSKSRLASRDDYAALKRETHMMQLLGGTLDVVHFFGAYEDDGYVYLVMERCVGGDLSARLDGEKGHDRAAGLDEQEEQAKMYMREILYVVRQCHALHIVHRDLKLENFVFADATADSPLKLTDFGGAAFLEAGTFLNDVHGTPLYTAPEVLKRKYAFPSDLWSCGVILYRLLSGHFPFASGPLLDERILHEAIDLESLPWTGISHEAKDLVQRLLERNVSKRLTAEQALQHPWFAPRASLPTGVSSTQSVAASEATKRTGGSVLSGTLVQRLQLYRSLTILQRAVLNEVTGFLPLELKHDVLELYSQVARDGSEIVGLEEFAVYVAASGYRLTRGEAKGFFRNLDLDGTGRVSRNEFCAALLDWPLLQRQHRDAFAKCADRVFDTIDQDKDGLLTVKDMAELAPFRKSDKCFDLLHDNLNRCCYHTNRFNERSIDKDDFKRLMHLSAGAYAKYPQRLER